MKHDPHLSDQKLLLDLEGELSAHDAKKVAVHTAECWRCRARREELEKAIVSFVRVQRRELDANLPNVDGPRALLQARLAEAALTKQAGRSNWFLIPDRYLLAAAVCALAVVGFLGVRAGVQRRTWTRRAAEVVYVPDARLTPGATVLVSRRAVCSQVRANNKMVPVNLQRRVFEEYGLTGADPRAYEVDYLVTPALGGADDIHNLWPHSYSATVWNAQVKDALEDRLREMVCDGDLDLAEAQKEIAENWIGAYKKYFHTDVPLSEHWR